MVTPYAAPPATEDDDEPRSRWTVVGRVAVILVAVGITALWVFAFFFDHGVPGRLESTAFPTAAEPICQATKARIAELPRADETPTASGRADVVDQASDELDAMLAQLRAQVPAGTAETQPLDQWIDDWQTYVHDRRDYTAQLRVDPMTRFAVTQSDRDNSQITQALDRFATINAMPSCTIPDDLS